MFYKVISTGEDWKKRCLTGVEKVDEIIGGTLGPGGHNIITQTKYKAPNISNDGANNARRIVLDDVIADMAAQTIIEISMRTADQAGDGTTTSVVIASEITRKCMKLLSEKTSILEKGVKVSPMKLRRQIQEECEKAVSFLKKSSKKLKDGDLDNIISTSLENLEYGKTLADLIRTVGVDGYISVEDNWATKYGITTEATTGMRFLGTYASPYLATSKDAKEAIWENTHVLVCNSRIETPAVLENLIKEFHAEKVRKLVIIGGYSEGENPFSPTFIQAVASGVRASAQGKDAIQILAVKASSLTTFELQDVSDFCGTTLIDKALGEDVKDVQLAHLGFANKVVVNETEVLVIGGRGDTKERIKTLKAQVETEKDPMFKGKLERRIASLASGVGVIRVGALTESDRTYLKEKIVDAVNAGRAAIEEGYVKGGGIALKEVATKLGKDALLHSALTAPYERICSNAGESDIKIPDSVVDPLKVVRLALENACSGAGTLITTGAAIADKKMEYGDYLEKAMRATMNRDDDDFRSDENQDQGRGNIA